MSIANRSYFKVGELERDLKAAKLREAECGSKLNHYQDLYTKSEKTALDNHKDIVKLRLQLKTTEQERNAALSALEIARTAARKAHLALQIGHNDYTDYGLIAVFESMSNPSAALAERDRAIRQDVVNQMEEMEVLLPIDYWGGTKQQLLVEFHKALIANIRQKFGI